MSVKLPPHLKALLADPAAHGSPLPAPSPLTLKAALDAVRKAPVGTEIWLALASAVVMTVNSPAALCDLYDYAAAHSDGVAAAALIREVGLKCTSLIGAPRIINNLVTLRAHLPAPIVARLSTTPQRTHLSAAESDARATHLWESIYEPHAAKLVAKLSDAHPDLAPLVLEHHYGALLADPPGPAGEGACRLGRVLTSVVAIASLRSQGGVGPQVTSHVFGLKKALMSGAGGVEGAEWVVGDEGIVWVVESVDALARVLRGVQQ